MSAFKEIFRESKDGALSSKRVFGAIGFVISVCNLCAISWVILLKVIEIDNVELVLGANIAVIIICAVLLGGGSIEKIISKMTSMFRKTT